MRQTWLFTFLIALMFAAPMSAHAGRIKDIAAVEGARDNSLIGYGLVIGLNGTGDKTGTTFTMQTLSSMLNKMGIVVDPKAVKTKNVAAVVVTANLPPFVKVGGTIDVVVSSLGDATSLQGGTLLLTNLKGPDQKVYAVAQGPISIGGFVGGGNGDSVQKNHPTVGRAANGAVVEREVGSPLAVGDVITLLLRQQDFTTAMRISEAVNSGLGSGIAEPVDSGTIRVRVPEEYKNRVVDFLAAMEGLEVTTDSPAKVVVNERTGTIVMGEHVRISEVAVSHGNLTIRVKTDLNVSQPAPFSERGRTVVTPEQQTTVKEEDAKIMVLHQGTSIGDVVVALNAIGVTPRDLIAILQAIKAAGALQAELEIL
ncbi:MAG TPA: flagellar basal body P-ring protein FlgI [Nitrospiria bacterium]|nr:flagellar basal body P-ring protein FlgI [Nitrospiria bacterium]